MKILCKPENDAEALAVMALLDSEEIPYAAESYHDTAYDGLFQTQFGWGVIRVADDVYDSMESLYLSWKDAFRDDPA
ncbi:MAG: hypothetical protein JXR25_11375 [Pontiellaceae bacterium]|nr:hypothetical protein [Pontiellaceae bacterium]MBN2785414.1 hypothetical protein [Pontiellaceae bacterium]